MVRKRNKLITLLAKVLHDFLEEIVNCVKVDRPTLLRTLTDHRHNRKDLTTVLTVFKMSFPTVVFIIFFITYVWFLSFFFSPFRDGFLGLCPGHERIVPAESPGQNIPRLAGRKPLSGTNWMMKKMSIQKIGSLRIREVSENRTFYDSI